MSADKKDTGQQIVEYALIAMTKQFDALIQSCMSENGELKAPSRQAIAAARGCMPKWVKSSYKPDETEPAPDAADPRIIGQVVDIGALLLKETPEGKYLSMGASMEYGEYNKEAWVQPVKTELFHPSRPPLEPEKLVEAIREGGRIVMVERTTTTRILPNAIDHAGLSTTITV